VKLALSRFACVRAERGRLVAEGPRGLVNVDPDAIVLLVRAAESGGVETDAGDAYVEPLVAAGVLVTGAESAREQESVWSFHERLFHARTRPADRSAWDATRRPPPDALPERAWGAAVPLKRPDLDAIERDDPPFARVQANRKSQRAYRPLTVARLGELLFRVGRVDDLWELGGVTYATRPYPSAGALYELELFVAAHECEGVEPGLYHYAAAEHGLARVPAAETDVDRLVADAAAGMGVEAPPPALIVIAARFPRLATKYGPLAYSLVLKNVGVLMQTMCLSATAMGLGACAVGAGDAQLFARATGLPIEEETSVGELCLGEPAG
jgi:SagB-type dehydrogenase family enzyme